jgi:hypothetical protein
MECPSPPGAAKPPVLIPRSELARLNRSTPPPALRKARKARLKVVGIMVAGTREIPLYNQADVLRVFAKKP